MKNRLLIILFIFGTLPLLRAQTPTFSGSVGTILYNNCTTCHRSGGIGPFALESYSDAVNNALAIQTAVSSGVMPPWPPDTAYSRFSHERTLTNAQITQIVDWVDGNMPHGNPANDPAVPIFNNNSQLSQPASATYKIPTYTITSTHDDYRAFVIPSQIANTQAVTEVEFMPANKSIVHHILVYYDTSGICQQLDNDDPLPGYTAFGGIGNSNAKQIAGWVPGSPALRLPVNFGMPAYHNGKYVIQIHYAPGSQGKKDSTRFAVVYKPITPTMREVFQLPILNHFISLTNGPLIIAANQKKKFIETQGMPIPISILGVQPHMHLIGRDKKVYAMKPGVTDTTKIIRIKDWNFNWQGQYMFKKLLTLPMGAVLWSESMYDNTEDNPYNPSSPPVNVVAGESTLNEMMMTYFSFVASKPGDESIILDSTLVTNISYQKNAEEAGWSLYPNPAKEEMYVVCQALANGLTRAKIEIFDTQGRKVKSESLSENGSVVPGSYKLNISGLKAGMYRAIVSQQSNSTQLSFVKQ